MEKKTCIYIILAVAALATVACKKDDSSSSDSKPSLLGLGFDLRPFGRIGDTYNLSPRGLYASDASTPSGVTYSWQLNTGTRDTTDLFTYTASSVRLDTLKCYAAADGYYSTSATQVISIIDPTLGKTLTGTGINATDAHVVDARSLPTGENTYYYTQAAGLDWFRNNLAYTGAGVAYENAEVTSYVLGRYYTWEEAQTACPEGWRLPTDEEWAVLGDTAGELMAADVAFSGTKMWEYWPEMKVETPDKYHLAAIPAGYALTGGMSPSFKGIQNYAMFWTATSSTEDGNMALYRYIHVKEPKVLSTYGDKHSLALSVRCVR